jgi:hypothetical protein
MSAQKSMLPAVVITGSSLLVGCGSNGSCGSGGSCTTTPPPGTGGVFSGTVAGTAAVAILADNGDMRIGVQDGTYYHLSVAPQTTTVAGSYFAYSTGAAFPNGTDATSGTVSATEGGATLTGTLTDHSGTTEALALNDNPVYVTGSALANLAGTWSYTASGFNLTATIASDGSFTATDSRGCTYSGTFGQIDERYDVYGENHVLTCNGIETNFDGLATYFPASGSTAASIELLADDSAGAYLAVTFK